MPSSQRTGRGRRLLWAFARLLFVGLAVVFLSRALQWDDRFVVSRDGSELVGVELLHEGAGDAVLIDEAGTRIALTPQEASAAQHQPGVRKTLARASYGAMAIAFVLLIIGITANSIRWWSLLRLFGSPTGLRDCVLIVFRALPVNLILPGSVGGDVYRAAALARLGVPLSRATLSIVVDRLVGLWSLMVLASVLALVDGSETFAAWAVWALVGCVAAPVVGFGLMALVPERIRRIRVVEAGFAFLTELKKRPWAVIPVVGASWVNWTMQISALLALLAAYWSGPMGAGAAVGAGLGLVANALPLAPGGLGVGEAAYVWLLARVGAPAAAVLAMSLTYRVAAYAAAGLALLLFLRSSEARA
ncbi:MAG TPA: hypothetical protein DFS52_19705, partial [Myxococcales bacterium]|nr:hypothetical protein [Myxococcales bacterium]